MKSLTLILSILAVGCGAVIEEAPARSKYLKIDGYEDYVRDFQNESIIHLKPTVVDNLIIEDAVIEDLVNDEGKKKAIILAKCYYNGYYGNNTPRIIIDPVKWAKSTAIRKRLVMLHEFGHCILRQPHRDSRPSIMNTMIIKDKDFKVKPDYYLDELFNPEKYVKKKQKKPVRGVNP